MSIEISTVSRSWATTTNEIFKHEFTWEISNINLRGKEFGHKIDSPIFNIGVKKTCWSLQIYPAGDSEDTKDHISLYLSRVSCNGGYGHNVQVSYRFVVSNTKNEVKKKSYMNGTVTFTPQGSGNGYRKLIKSDLLFDDSEKCLQNDKTKIICQMTIIMETKHASGEGQLPRTLYQACVSHQGLAHVLKSHKFSDVTLIANGKEFEAHKVILAAESPVFEAMFLNDTKEVREGRVEISDVHPDVVEEMLRFIYIGNSSWDTTGERNKEPQFALDLFQAADKYQIDRLKTICEDIIIENLCLESAVDTLRVAYLHNSRYLQGVAKKFMEKISAELIVKMIAEGCLTKTELMRNTSSNDTSLIGVESFEKEDAVDSQVPDSS